MYNCVYVRPAPDGGPTTVALRRDKGYVHLQCDFALPGNSEAAIAAGISRTTTLPDLEMDHSMLLHQLAWIVVKASIASHPQREAEVTTEAVEMSLSPSVVVVFVVFLLIGAGVIAVGAWWGYGKYFVPVTPMDFFKLAQEEYKTANRIDDSTGEGASENTDFYFGLL